jgi:hypothetical protein
MITHQLMAKRMNKDHHFHIDNYRRNKCRRLDNRNKSSHRGISRKHNIQNIHPLRMSLYQCQQYLDKMGHIMTIQQ